MMKYHDQKQLGEEGFIWIPHILSHSPLKEAKAGTQTGQEPGSRSCCRRHGGCRTLACSVCFLTGLLARDGSAYNGLGPSQAAIRIFPTGLPTASSYVGIRSIEVSFSDDSILCQANRKLDEKTTRKILNQNL